jgi:hypothetical protein
MKNLNRQSSIGSVRCTKGVPLLLLVTFLTLICFPLEIHAQPLQTPINLGSAAPFSVLAASALTSGATPVIYGDVGVSPTTGASITGLLATDVTGTIYTVDAGGPVGSVMDPARLSAAQSALTAAFNDAAGRTPIPSGLFLDPGAGDIGGMTLEPGLYKFTATLGITGTNVTLAGSDTSVWIFQIGTAFNVAAGIQVILTGGAKANNVFWQVGSAATLGAASVMKGTIMADQAITMNAGAIVEGRLLARVAAITTGANTTISLPPKAPGSPRTVTGIAGNAQIRVSWLAPLSDSGSLITYYTATAVEDTAKKCTSTDSLACVVTGLNYGSTYTFIVTATNAGGTSLPSAPSEAIRVLEPPTTIAYLGYQSLYSLNAPALMIRPTVTGGTDSLVYTVFSGVLPAGLSIGANTGNIYGTATETGDFTTVIRVSNSAGFAEVTLQFTVHSAAPVISYVPDTLSYTLSTPIATLAPTNTGGRVLSWSISPNLNTNTGLLFNTTTGRITGIPVRATAATTYTVTAFGESGTQAQTTVTIATTTAAPTVSYADTTYIFLLGQPINDIIKTGTTGIINSFSISPGLPAGLQFNTTTGRISGTPLVATPETEYVITATGPGGTGTDTIRIATVLNGPVIAFAADTVTFVRGAEITPFRPANTGGPINGWSISLGSNGNSLTANTGLLFNPTTGRILGTPVYLSTAISYVVTANGLSGAQSRDTIAIAIVASLSKTGLIEPSSFAIRVNGNFGSTYSLQIPAAFGYPEGFTVTMTDLSGRTVWARRVESRIDTRSENSSQQDILWDGRNSKGQTVSAGMYTVRITSPRTGDHVLTK